MRDWEDTDNGRKPLRLMWMVAARDARLVEPYENDMNR